MKFGFRIPSLSKRVTARTSISRYIKHNKGLKVPRGYGIYTNPRKALYNKVYQKTTTGCAGSILFFLFILFILTVVFLFN